MSRVQFFYAVRPTSWVKFGTYILMLALLYMPTLQRLVLLDWDREDYNYCYLIPFVVLYLVWEKKNDLNALPSRSSWFGLLPLIVGLILFGIGELGGEFFTLYISFWLMVVGLIWSHLGWEKLKTIWFAIVMMLGMFPLPNIINVRLTFGLKLLSSQIGVMLLHLYGMSAYREGNIIDLGFTQLQVVEACSGLRYVMPLLVLSLILAYWYKTHIWKRLILVASSVPIAIFVNSFRIAATGVLYSIWGASVAEGFFHGFSGWLIFMFTIPVLLVEMYILRFLPPKGVEDVALPAESPETVGRGEPTKLNKALFEPFFVVTIILLAGALVFSKSVDIGEKIPIKKPLSSLPMTVGEWTGEREQMEQRFIDALQFSDYAVVNYSNGRGRVVNFYAAYYESQRKGETAHSPESCLPGSGWVFREAGITRVPLDAGRVLPVMRAYIEKSGSQQLTYYWFAQRGRILTNAYQVKLYSIWDALTRHRTDGALVRLITPVYQNETPEDAEKRLQGFVTVIQPILQRYIPE